MIAPSVLSADFGHLERDMEMVNRSSADWFHLYGGEVDVRREFVPAETLRQWDEAPVEDVTPWSGLATALGRGRQR